jgi:Na+/H+ antiporter
MALFESVLTLLLVAIVLLQVTRRSTIPYPAMLALAGVAVAALPWAPDIQVDPKLAMTLFIAPALLDAAYDFPPRALRRYWLPLIALAAIAVLLTTAAVAWIGVVWAGLPLAAAIALGAIVAPPDAAAASAMLGRFALPRSTVTVLKGESLLNDAVALLIFGAAVGNVGAGLSSVGFLSQLALAVPGGVLFGFVCGKIVVRLARHLVGTLSGLLFQFVATFGVWMMADRLHLSAILAMVAFAMILARYTPDRTPANDRMHAYSVWETTVFVLNVVAFLLVGLQAREIVSALHPAELWQALRFAALVVAVVIVVRVVWVLLYNRLVGPIYRLLGRHDGPSLKQGVVAAWCGMRGLVTLATALALPGDFPGRGTIVLSALAVVLGTLVLQGITLGPLIRWLRFAPDHSFDREVAAARVVLLDAALASLGDADDQTTTALRFRYTTERAHAAGPGDENAVTKMDELQRKSLAAQRAQLSSLRRADKIDDDVFHALELELDRTELGANPRDQFELEEG